MTSLREECETLRQTCSDLETELATVKIERDELIKNHQSWQAKTLNLEKRDRILAALLVGKQSPTYKRVKAVLDQMMS
jgi:hypothetical protein